MSFTLRPYAASDFTALYELDRDCYPPGIAYSQYMLRWYLRAPGAICLLSESSSKEIQGFILVEAEPPRGHIITLDVAESARRHGLGTQLTSAAESAMAERGVATVELETRADDSIAIAFWQSRGYRAVGRIPRYYLDRIDAHVMRKTLGPAPNDRAAKEN